MKISIIWPAFAISEKARKTGCKLEGMQPDEELLWDYTGCRIPGSSEKLSFKSSFEASVDYPVCKSQGSFQLGIDYNFECQKSGILVTSNDSVFELTDRAENIEEDCKAISHWSNPGGSIFLPKCMQIKENTRNWNRVIISRKEGPRKWKSKTIMIECSDED
ncbi:Oidioi.mRNA.OKI2018_I69.chr2.g4534.t1.cds [Oikopleura dioica]|uniref:Oidioi.mRNA.OKI2018_I69.chr2.g4534.t1.cds n=1 Tax=Oikopleura dioica TaxID=34765 RepID=A0ABN7T490_OIKDI|nr:Oidioi.mRNA.OKI2018_I69.chr2.g4534.t1.cds [Oikopleura dioica]